MAPALEATASRIELSSRGRNWSGFGVALIATPAARVEVGPSTDHRLSIHAAEPVRAICRCDGLVHRRLQVQGDIDIVPAGCGGAWHDEHPSRVLLVSVTPRLLDEAAEAAGIRRVELEPRLQVRDPRLEHIAWALRAELECGEPGERLYAESLGTAFAAQLVRHHGRAAGGTLARQKLTRAQLRRVLEHIEANLASDLSLEELAAVTGLSTSHFKTLFKRTTGIAAHQHVVRRRVERARELLSTGRRSIAEVAFEAGFAHQSHLARCMRRVLGVTPMDIVRARR